jgi:RNA polymerase sigma-70 factor (ECF subfamily)
MRYQQQRKTMQRDLIEAVIGARRGDADATETLVRRALTLALRTSAATLGSREEAADVAQEVVIDVLRDLRKLRDPSRFDAWVHRVTARRALRHLQAKRSRLVSDLDSLHEHEQPATHLNESELATQWSVTPALRAALAELPPRQRVALALKYVAGLSDSEIAAALDCRRGTADSLLSRGRSALQANPLLADLRPSRLQGEA